MIMKYLYIFLAIFLLSCAKESNSNYQEINDIMIEGVTDQTLHNVISFKDTLKINTTIKGRFSGDDTEGLEFEWKLIAIKGNNVFEGNDFVISREKNLKHYVTENPGMYYGSYTVTDIKNDAKFIKRFFVNVRSVTSEGWAILCDEGGESRLDWIFDISADSIEVVHSLWSDKNYNMGKPVSLNFFYNMSSGSFRLANTENGSFNLDPLLQTAGENRNMIYQFFTVPERVDIRGGASVIMHRDPEISMLIDVKGDIYTKETRDVGVMFDYRCNIVSGESDYFVAAPYVAIHHLKYNEDAASIILYDQTNCRFVEFQNNAIYPSVAKFDGTMFQPTANHELIFMETTMEQNSFAVLKNKSSGKYYIYGFRIRGAGVNEQQFYTEIKGPELDKLNKIVFHNINNYMFYTASSKVYQFKIPNKGDIVDPAKEAISLPGETIVDIMLPKFAAWEKYESWETYRANQLVVASNRDNMATDCGNVRIYDVPSLSAPLILKKEYTNKGLGKIVDIEYFERDKPAK